MSVIVRGMEMPMTCSDCEWSEYVGNGRAMCRRVSKTDKTDIMTKRRADFCPLISIPTPHGRLIDADELGDRMHGKWTIYDYEALGKSPTVIDAER